jgi:serine/threonine protein kinase
MRARSPCRLFVLAAALLAALVLAGCAPERGQILRHWTLDVPGRAPRAIDLPARLEGDLPSRFLVYHLRTTVRLDPALAGREVELVLPYLPAFATLSANGREARLVGDPGPASEYGGTLPRRWLLPASTSAGDAPVTLELSVTHRWSPSARVDVAPELVVAGSPSPIADRNRLLNEQGAWFGLIALSQVGVTFLAVYFWDRQRKAYLWFAVQALTASYYPAYVAGLPALWFGWTAQNVLLANSLCVAPIVSVYFTSAFFGLPRPSRAWAVLLVVALLSPTGTIGAYLLSTPGYHAILVPAICVVACVLSATVYQIVTGIRLLRTSADKRTVVLFLCCWLALGGSSWVDLMAWGGGPDVLGGGRPACVGLGLFAIFQSILLGRSHFRSLADADRLNDKLRKQVHDLEERQGEIQSLNDELRRQVGRRTSDILAALTDSDGGIVTALQPGDLFDARYRVIAPLGAGGMGAVYEVERLSDKKRLALKMAQELRGMALARLAREAQIATQVHHTNVVSVVDADVAQGGYAYIVMELVHGRTLAECGKGKGLVWRLRVLSQILQGVKALHGQGIIHRDLKPSNVLVADDESTAAPRVKITDFGISRWIEESSFEDAPQRAPTGVGTAVDAAAIGRALLVKADPKADAPTLVESRSIDSRSVESRPGESRSGPLRSSTPQLTRTGQVSGTPAYVAPELAGGTHQLGPAVDVFAFGVVAFGLLTGESPFKEPPFLARVDGREVPPAPSIASLCSTLSGRLTTALDAALSFTPEARPSVDDVISLIDAELTGSTPSPIASAPPATLST